MELIAALFMWLFADMIKYLGKVFIWSMKAMWYLFTWPFYLLGWFLKNKTSASVEFYNLNGKKIKDMNGLEYEHAAAKWLVTQGYHSVAVTPASNDFGADITAKDKNGQVWVFQCKHYSAVLDNKPIQEVVASKAHYGAVYAGVIANSGFTKAAQLLSAENNVKLITLK